MAAALSQDGRRACEGCAVAIEADFKGEGEERLLAAENFFELLGWHDFQLLVGAGLRFSVAAPTAELRGVAEAVALHVIIGDFNDELGAQGFPRQIFSLAPAALAAGHALWGIGGRGNGGIPFLPGMMSESVSAVRCEEFGKFETFFGGETGTNANMLERSGVIVEPEEEGADGEIAFLVPAKTGDDTIAIAFVLDLEHGAFIGLIDAGEGLCNDAVETGSFKALEPIGRDIGVGGGGCEVNGRRGRGEQFLQPFAPEMEGLAAQIAIAFAEQVEEDEGGRALL